MGFNPGFYAFRGAWCGYVGGAHTESVCHDNGFAGAVLNVFDAGSEARGVKGCEGNDAFAGQLLVKQEVLDDHRGSTPPDRISDIDGAVAFKADVGVLVVIGIDGIAKLFLREFGGGVVVFGVRLGGYDAVYFAFGFALNRLREGFGSAGFTKVDDDRFGNVLFRLVRGGRIGWSSRSA